MGDVYACFWVHGKNLKTGEYISRQGNGRAGGWGYDMMSSASYEAMINAGIEYDENFDGVGMDKVRHALVGLAKEMGYKKIHICDAHS